MLIAQITDLHLGFDPDDADEPNRQRLEAVVTRLGEGPNRPALLLVTGDLTDRGDRASYVRVRNATKRLPVPCHPLPGNHDDRRNFAAVFDDVPMPDGFVQYEVRVPCCRLLLIDTLEPGRQGGGFCDKRAAWLAARLGEDRDTPTIIVMHHPPVATGIAWIDVGEAEPWVSRFTAAVDGHAQIAAIWCGHLHRPIATRWRGIPVTVCPSVSAALTLDLRPIDPERQDGRSLVIDARPGYALHRLTPDGPITLFDTVGEDRVLARFDDRMQPLIRATARERGDR